MAEIVPQETGKKRSSRKNLIRVDMTPMVDLGFLLITFFMFTTNFSKPNVMDLGLPAKGPVPDPKPVIDYRNQLTFILGENDRIFYYQQELSKVSAADLKEISLEGIKIPKLIDTYYKAAPTKENFTIIIKPTEKANYKNFVDMLDNLAITGKQKYGITDIQPLEEKAYEEILK